MLVLREENELLRAERDIALQKIQQLTAMLANCVVTPAQIAPTRSQFNSLDLLLPPYHQNEDPRQSATLPPHLYQTSNPFPSTAILDPLTAVDLILKGKVDYVRMNKRSDFEVVNSLVSTISQEQFNLNMPPKGLKEATITLGKFLGQPKSPLYTQYMVKIITEAAKSLCLTSNGNYLCQQLLEKCNSEDKLSFIKQIEKDMFAIANDMFGVHVLVKAVGIKELEVASVQVCADSQAHIVAAMVSYGIYESLQTGARKVWRPYLSKCRAAGETEIFEKIKGDMTGHWADLAVSSQHGTISVQQMFEGCATQDILEDLCRVATNEFGHYLIKRFLGLEPMFHAAIFTGPMFNALCNAILTSYPPLATNYYGVRFVETVIDSNRILQRPNAIKYLNSLCSQKDGRIPAIVEVANSSVGRGHLQFVLRHMPRHGDGGLMGRVRSTCRQFQTTLRNSQSGNELLRRLGLINTPSRRF
ncbi:ARM repeat-containing protein [Cutaneotrichosporon oleaginosum]|uniref:ARM repeat-containing protein n=1 Tax=Cutaneotrichosporon oleaginosum TaxID=879819 RepID=A0A0J0XKD4_9TREE|nr:ARM repeat-containing protein [Cutaneotrichosporon oleaginosum]KLT41556.1 ARM repeat-containing protein [Cutaneotrichosporon oleaginosum]TXT09322.1 hypothetical protein COLE_03256 [Cutaneotrichosporon oleaginosum]